MLLSKQAKGTHIKYILEVMFNFLKNSLRGTVLETMRDWLDQETGRKNTNYEENTSSVLETESCNSHLSKLSHCTSA